MPDYLLEIGTEELPADQVTESQKRLKSLVADALGEANVPFAEVIMFGTPRRITCLVKGIAATQTTVTKKVSGPAVKASFDATGKALPPAIGFAQKHGLSVDELGREDVGGTEKLVANVTIEGKPVGSVLSDIVPSLIMQLSGERLMRWGSSDLKFSRPIRWLVSLLDTQEVPVQLDSIKSARDSFGNRVLAPGSVEIKSTGQYMDALKDKRVLACPDQRQKLIKEQVQAIAASVKGKPRQLDGSLLDEVINLTEWPHAVLGEFEKEYLDLPDKLIETIMIHHQRYFPVESATAENGQSKLLPYFVTVANNDRKEAQSVIKQGNERVIRARLADGRFFYFDDRKTKLRERTEALSQLTYQEGLGSYLDKTNRLVECARILIDSLSLPPNIGICLERTAELCKLDLVTNLVRELPELQGYVGSWYAEYEGEPPDVVKALASHYAPRSQDDSIPPDTVGQFAALIDKLDNLVGMFALGRKPSGSSDPYALRRQAQGVVDILFDGISNYTVNVSALLEVLLELLKPWLSKRKNFAADKTLADVREFLMVRVRTKLQEKGFRREIIDAVLSNTDPLTHIADTVVRCDVLQTVLSDQQGIDVVRAGVRIGNILTPESPSSVNEAHLSIDAEKDLFNAFQSKVVTQWEKQGQFVQPVTKDEYLAMINLLKPLIVPVNSFFDNVMVNDPDVQKKNNRHAMLKLIYQYYDAIADFPKLQPLLP